MHKIQEKVLKIIKKNNLIKIGESVLVGLSGGPDSVCLLHILLAISKELNINNIFASHINHMLRGIESDMDEEFVKKICEESGVKLFTTSINIKEIAKKENISIEEAAREKRYEQLFLQAERIGNCKIAVGHNKNDQAETIMMNIIRGTGLDGLKGMEYINGNVIRPLLDIERNEIEKYCNNYKLNPRVDSTNLKTTYTRNKIRLKLLPFILKEFGIDPVESICRMAPLIKDDYLYLTSISQKMYKKSLLKENSRELDLDIKEVNNCHISIKRRVIREAIRKVKGNLTGIESIHVSKIIDLCQGGRTGAKIQLPKGVCARKSYNNLKIYVSENTNISRVLEGGIAAKEIVIPGITTLNTLNASLNAQILDIESFNSSIFRTLRYDSLTQYFDYDKLLNQRIEVRSREEGDVLKPYKCKGTKKLKKYLIDNKIPREERDRIPLIVIGKEVIWVIGHKISNKFLITKNTKKVLKLKYKKKDSFI